MKGVNEVMLEQKGIGSYRVYIPSRRMVYSVRKFVVSKSYPLHWGWKRREQLIEDGKYNSMINDKAKNSINKDMDDILVKNNNLK